MLVYLNDQAEVEIQKVLRDVTSYRLVTVTGIPKDRSAFMFKVKQSNYSCTMFVRKVGKSLPVDMANIPENIRIQKHHLEKLTLRKLKSL